MYRLLADEPFFAALSRRLDKRASTQVPAAGVRITEDGRFEMVYNLSFMQKMVDESPEDRPLLFVKESQARVLPLGLWPLWFSASERAECPRSGTATDLAINSHIADELPEWAFFRVAARMRPSPWSFGRRLPQAAQGAGRGRRRGRRRRG